MKKVFGISNEDVGIVVRVFDADLKDVCANYWIKELNLSNSALKGFEIVNGKKEGKLPYGMCRVRIRKGGDYLKKIKALNLKLSELVLSL